MGVRGLAYRCIPSNAVCHMHIHECSAMSVCTRKHCLQYPRAPRSIAEPRDVVRSANCLIAMVCLSQFLEWSRCAHTMYACFTIRKYSLESNRHRRTVCRAQSCRPIVIIIRFVHAFSLCFDWFLPARALHLYRSRVRPGGVRSVFCRSLFRHRSLSLSRFHLLFLIRFEFPFLCPFTVHVCVMFSMLVMFPYPFRRRPFVVC